MCRGRERESEKDMQRERDSEGERERKVEIMKIYREREGLGRERGIKRQNILVRATDLYKAITLSHLGRNEMPLLVSKTIDAFQTLSSIYTDKDLG